jgi:hypothetical protein
MSKAKSGGGITSNKLVRPQVRGGSPSANRVNVTGVSQLGNAQGNHASDPSRTVNVKREPIVAAQMAAVPLGNAIATNVGAGGPGKGRTIFRTGSQGRHG